LARGFEAVFSKRPAQALWHISIAEGSAICQAGREIELGCNFAR